MQLGTRWQAHTEAPKSLPEAIRDSISHVERELTALHIDSSGWYWTLTYLENRPVVQLDDGTTITITADGYTTITQAE